MREMGGVVIMLWAIGIIRISVSVSVLQNGARWK